MSAVGGEGVDTFLFEDSGCGAYNPGSRALIFVVEAESEVDALTNVDSVAPLFGFKEYRELDVVQLDELPSDVPTFLKAYFKTRRCVVDDRVPGTGGIMLH